MKKKLLFLLLFFCLVSNSFALEERVLNNKEIIINSEELVFDREKNVATFTKNVHVELSEANIFGSKIVVYMRDDSKLEGEDTDKIKRIIITGNVKIKTDKEVITSDRADYEPNKNQITLIDNVVLTQNNNVVTGDKLIYDTLNKTTKIFSEKKDKRIRAKFTFDKNE